MAMIMHIGIMSETSRPTPACIYNYYSTCLGCDAYIHDHFLEYRHNYALFYQLLNSNLFTHRMICVRERSL